MLGGADGDGVIPGQYLRLVPGRRQRGESDGALGGDKHVRVITGRLPHPVLRPA